MGFDLFEGKTTLDFSRTRYAGVEVVVRSDVCFEEYEQFLAASDLVTEWEWFKAHALVEWNLERKGVPLAVDLPLSQLPTPFVRRLIRAWQAAFTEIDAPLGEGSASGDASRAEPIQ